MDTEAFGKNEGVGERVVDPRFVTTYVDESAVYTKTLRQRHVFSPVALEIDGSNDCAIALAKSRNAVTRVILAMSAMRIKLTWQLGNGK